MEKQLREVGMDMHLNTAHLMLLVNNTRGLYQDNIGLDCWGKAQLLKERYAAEEGIESELIPSTTPPHAGLLIRRGRELHFADPSLTQERPLMIRDARGDVNYRDECGALPIVCARPSIIRMEAQSESVFRVSLQIFDGSDHRVKFFHDYSLNETVKRIPDIQSFSEVLWGFPRIILKYRAKTRRNCLDVAVLSYYDDHIDLRAKDFGSFGGFGDGTTTKAETEFQRALSDVSENSGISLEDLLSMLFNVKGSLSMLGV